MNYEFAGDGVVVQARSSMRILVVEDDPILGEGIAIGLRQTKATVDWFRSAEDAMAALATESFSAVV